MIEHAAISEQGPVRPNNEDYITRRCPEDAAVRQTKGSLFVIADGVGGSMAGEVASREAAETLTRVYYELPSRGYKALPEAFKHANLRVYDLGQTVPECRQMQTTLSALAIAGRQAIIVHAGDSRIYRVRGREVQQLTHDHTEVAELMRLKIITPEEARTHFRRNIINRSLGSNPFLRPDFYTHEIELGDVFVLCTDGLWEPVLEAEIAETVGANPPALAARRLLDLAIERKTSDNLSIQVAKVVEWERNPSGNALDAPSLLQRTLQRLGLKQKGA